MITCQIGADCGCNFKNTGANYSHVWDEYNKITKSLVDCEECQYHGLKNLSGLRDHTKAGIGGVPFDKSNYRRFVKEVNCVFDKCNIEGRC